VVPIALSVTKKAKEEPTWWPSVLLAFSLDTPQAVTSSLA